MLQYISTSRRRPPNNVVSGKPTLVDKVAKLSLCQYVYPGSSPLERGGGSPVEACSASRRWGRQRAKRASGESAQQAAPGGGRSRPHAGSRPRTYLGLTSPLSDRRLASTPAHAPNRGKRSHAVLRPIPGRLYTACRMRRNRENLSAAADQGWGTLPPKRRGMRELGLGSRG